MGNDDAKLFVAGLPDSISEDVLKQLFEATGGSVVQVSLPKDRATGRPRGFGFVTMSSADQARAARDALDGSLQSGRSISVRPFSAEPPRRGEGGPPSSRYPSGPGGPGGDRGGPPRSGGPGGAAGAPDRTLYVGNLPYDCTQPELETLINGVTAGNGTVVRIHMPMDADGRKRGFGFVTMSSAETAKSAAELLKTADLRGRRLVVNLAHPKGERPAGEGGYRGGGGFGGGGFSGGGGSGFGPPAPPGGRKTFDSDRRRKQHASGGEDGPPKNRGSGKGTKSDPDDDRWDKRDWGDDD
jgi:RNA recognition motif-containing protein